MKKKMIVLSLSLLLLFGGLLNAHGADIATDIIPDPWPSNIEIFK